MAVQDREVEWDLGYRGQGKDGYTGLQGLAFMGTGLGGG